MRTHLCGSHTSTVSTLYHYIRIFLLVLVNKEFQFQCCLLQEGDSSSSFIRFAISRINLAFQKLRTLHTEWRTLDTDVTLRCISWMFIPNDSTRLPILPKGMEFKKWRLSWATWKLFVLISNTPNFCHLKIIGITHT